MMRNNLKHIKTLVIILILICTFNSCKKDADPDIILKCLYETEKGDYEKAEWYLKHYKNIEKSSVRGMDGKIYAPATFAAVRNDLKAMKLFIKYNVDLTKQDHLGATALFYAVQNQSYEMVKIILDNDNSVISIPDKRGVTPIDLSCSTEDFDIQILSLLLKNDADPNVITSFGYNVLSDAIALNRIEAFKMLLDNGADPYVLLGNGTNSIMHAIGCRNIEMLKEFIDRGYSMTEGYPLNVTAVHFASQTNNIDMLKLLVEKGVSIDVLDDQGRTPLESALESEKIDGFEYETVKYLKSLRK